MKKTIKSRTSKITKIIALTCVFCMLMSGATQVFASPADTEYANYAGVKLVENSNGLVLGYAKTSGVGILYDADSGYFFKDLNTNGKIDDYEDWRLDIETRTADLLSQMPLTEKFALMAHGGSSIEDGFRMSVVRSIGKGEQADGNNGNAKQKQAEATTFGIPYSYSSDPVHTGFQDTGADEPGSGGGIPEKPVVTDVSSWPNTLGLANTFSPETHYQFGQTIAQEYRNSQIFQQLGPVFDQVTHPTWSRSGAAVTEDYDLLIDLAQAEIAGMQTTEESITDYGLPEGWGKDSISAMAKHLLGTGTGEFGYEGHTDMGGWLVYPGGGYQKYIEAVTEASGIGVYSAHSSKVANAGMTAYAIDTGNDGLGRHNGLLGDKRYSLVGGAYSNFIMNEWLREGHNWDGMITSDWGCYGTRGSNHGMKPAQGMDTTEVRYLISFLSGMSQTGGTGSIADFQKAYDLGVNGEPTYGIPAYGEEHMSNLIDSRAGNAIKTIMKCGLFENPYSDPDKADAENGSADLNRLALQAHHDSIVMLKNQDDLLPVPMKTGAKVYAVGSYVAGSGLGTGYGSITHDYRGISKTASRFFGSDNMVDDPSEADYAIVMISGPNNSNGTAGVPQTAQWAPYTKAVGREVSIGGYWYHSDGTPVNAYEIPNPANGDYKENMSNIGYTTEGTSNAADMQGVLDVLLDTKEAIGDKPVVLFLNYRNAVCPAEIEPYADAILAGCWATEEAFMNLATGVYEPTALSAITFPRSMDNIEMSAEDVPDTTPYVDSDGNVYQFGFGLNYDGRIVDERTDKYLGLNAINKVELLDNGNVKVPIELLSYKYGLTGVTATAYYDDSELNLVRFEPASGYLLVGNGDRFTFANASAITTNTVIGYAIFEAANDNTSFDTSKVTFAMDGSAYDIDLNPTMARFNDAEVALAPPVLGDVSLDGIVDVRDAVLLLQYLVGDVELSEKQLVAADVNVDGEITVSDVVIIMQMTVA